MNAHIYLSEFKPTSVLNTCLKNIAKLLANILQRIISKLVHKNQYDFIGTVWDGHMSFFTNVANQKKEILVLKLDLLLTQFNMRQLSKFLELGALAKNGLIWLLQFFPWSHLEFYLMECLQNFLLHERVKYNEPQFLFLLAIDLLRSIFNNAMAQGILHYPLINSKNIDFLVLQYVDDTLVHL